MLVNIFINVQIVEAYLNQNKVIAVFFVAMVLKSVHQRIELPLCHTLVRSVILLSNWASAFGS